MSETCSEIFYKQTKTTKILSILVNQSLCTSLIWMEYKTYQRGITSSNYWPTIMLGCPDLITALFK